MVERQIELRRRRTRGAKLAKYKAKLAAAKDGKDRDLILAKIHRISPWWTEPGKEPAAKQPKKEPAKRK